MLRVPRALGLASVALCLRAAGALADSPSPNPESASTSAPSTQTTPATSSNNTTSATTRAASDSPATQPATSQPATSPKRTTPTTSQPATSASAPSRATTGPATSLKETAPTTNQTPSTSQPAPTPASQSATNPGGAATSASQSATNPGGPGRAPSPTRSARGDTVTVTLDPKQPRENPTGATVRVLVPDRDLGADASAADLLRLAPGVKLKAQGGDGQRQVAQLRGSSEEQVLILLDGVRLNEAGGGGVDLSQIPASSLARVEVVTGAAAALYGGEALGGVILLFSRSTGGRLSELSTAWGSFDAVRASATRADQVKKTALLASLNALSTEGDFLFTDTNGRTRQRRNNDARLISGFLKLNRPLRGPWRLEALLSGQNTQRGVPGPEQFESDSARQSDQRGLASFTLRGENVAPGLDYSLQTFGRGSWFSFSDPTPAIGVLVDSSAEEVALGSRGRFSLRSGAHRVGGEIALWGELLTADNLDDGAERRRRGSLVLADEYTTGRFTFSPALRLEGTTGVGLAPLPRLGAEFRAGPNVSLKLSGGRSYRPPSFRDLFVRVDGVLGSPDLLPEDAWEVSGAIAAQFRRAAVRGNVLYSAELGAYARHIENTILFTPESAFVIRAGNFSDLSARGAELIVAADRGWLRWENVLSLLRTESGASRLALPGLPARRLTSQAELRVFPGLRLVASLDAQSDFFLNRQNTQTSPARLLLSAGAIVSLPRGLSASLDLRNLLDQRNAVDGLQQPLPPRALTLTARAVF